MKHALCAYTAQDQRALRLAAETYRDNPRFDTQDAILQVGVGEAVASFLEKKGGARSCRAHLDQTTFQSVGTNHA